MKLLRNMHVFWKQVLVIGVLLLPLVGTSALLIRAESARIVDSAIKADGYRFNEPLEEMNSGLAQHMASAAAVELGDASALAGLREAQNHVDEALIAARDFKTEGGTDFAVEAAIGELQAQWEEMKSQAETLAYAESMRRHEQLFESLEEINEQAVDSGRMRLADNIETYYLADVSTNRIFEAERAIGRLVAALAESSAAHKPTPEQRTHIGLLMSSMAAIVKDIDDDLTTAMAGNEHSAQLRARIAPTLTELTAATEAFEQLIQREVIESQQVELSRADANAAAKRALVAIDGLHDVVQPSLLATQKTRMHGEKVQRIAQIAVIATLTVLAVCLAIVITHLITRPLRYAVRVFGKIAAGDFTSRIDVHGSDEPNRVLLALDGMQSKLRAQIESERAHAAENARIRSALDKSGSNVMLVDERLDVIYVNEAAQRLFREAEKDLHKDIPSLDADRLVGTNAATLLRTLPELMQALASLTQQLIADGRIGTRTLRVCANPVRTADGQRMGTVLEWIDRTQEVGAEQELGAVVKGALQGDLTLRVKQAGKTGFFATLAGSLNPLLDNVADVIKRIKLASQDVHRGAQEISAGNANLSARTEQQSSSLEEAASSMEEMTSTVRQNADNAAQANQLAVVARASAEKGGTVVQDAVRAMEAINQSSRKIADIIGVIDAIAFQTNLLALNAAVEAARAGEQGRGFAVVASEVRSLAGRSAGAAKEIKGLIQDSVARVEEGSTLVTQSGETLTQIIAAVKKVSDVVAEIASASREQASGIDQVGRAVMSMDQTTQQNAALVEQAAAASQSMAQQARALSDAVSRYRIGAATPLSSGSSCSAGSAPETRLPLGNKRVGVLEM